MVDGGAKMNIKLMTQEQIRRIGLEALAEKLGPVGMVRFLQLFSTGKGDYTKEREKWLGKASVRELVKEIKRERE